MNTTRRYINADYIDPLSKETMPGHKISLRADVKRGRHRRQLTVIWHAARLPEDDDGQYLRDPRFEVHAVKEGSDVRWARVDLPEVTGVRWMFKVVRQKSGKKDKTIKIPGVFETWKRIFLDVKTAKKELYLLFEKALPKIKRAFEAACIEIQLNRIVVDGTSVQSKDRSDGGRLGTVYEVELKKPEQTRNRIPYTIHVEDGVCSNASVAVHDGRITISLASYCEWGRSGGLKSIEIKTEPKAKSKTKTKTKAKAKAKSSAYASALSGLSNSTSNVKRAPSLFYMDHRGDVDAVNMGGESARRVLAGTIGRITTDQTMVIDTAVRPMSHTWDTSSKTWASPRTITVPQALARSTHRVTFKLDLVFFTTGGTGGYQQEGKKGIVTLVDEGEDRLASVICHELGHALGLASRWSVRRHVEDVYRYDSTKPPRKETKARAENHRYYSSEYGGAGPHCSWGTQKVSARTTTSGFTHVPRSGEYLCLMYHASLVDEEGAPRTRDVNFCPSCIQHLRGR